MSALRWKAKRTLWDLGMGSVVGLLSGAASAGFLWLLERVIQARVEHPWLLLGLPLFGMVSAWLYRTWGQEAEGGGSLIMDEVLDFKGKVPSRMAPLVLAGTLLTHLGGGSAGREGTAVQMGASLGRTVGKLPWRFLHLTRSRQRLLLMAGVSAGFGSLFGTPVAGTLFGMEVIAIGKIHYEGLLVCMAASFVGDGVCRLLGAQHPHYQVQALAMSGTLGIKLLLFAFPVALVAGSFTEGIHALAGWTKGVCASVCRERGGPPGSKAPSASPSGSPRSDRAEPGHAVYLRAALGGLAVMTLALVFRDPGYLNLGLPWLPRVFASAPVPPWAFAVKFVFTVVTLGFGFKGGEVTPLFVIGSLLGAALAPALGLPVPFVAAVGFIALFAAASNTPIASTFMGIELFGTGFAGPLVLTCFMAYILVGHRGIYGGHRVSTNKDRQAPGEG